MSNYFIRIDDAKDTRRKILESSKSSLQVLKRYQQLLKIRGEKLSMVKKFRHELKELTVLVNRMDELLPQFTEKELSNLKEAAELPALGKPKRRGRKKSPAGREVFIGQPEKMKNTKGRDIELKKQDLKEEELSDLEKLEQKLRMVESSLDHL